MYRVIVNGVSFYTSKAAIKRGVGDDASINAAVSLCLQEMGRALGLAKNYVFYDSKMRSQTLQVQVDRIQ